MTQVTISDTIHTVTVNHDGCELQYVIDKAQQLWKDTAKPVRQPSGFDAPAASSNGHRP